MIDDLCIAVRDQLNAATFTPPFTVTINDSPEFDIEDLASLKVTMLPFGVMREAETRGHDSEQFVIQIAFQKHAPARPEGGTDSVVTMSKELRNLQQTVANWLSVRSRRIPPTYTTARLRKIEQVPLYDSTALRQERRYVGVMQLTYDAIVRPT